MARFVTVHRSPGLSSEEIAANAPLVAESEHATFRNLLVDMLGGFIVSVYEADDVASLEAEFERIGFPWDEIHEVSYETDAAGLQEMLAKGGDA